MLSDVQMPSPKAVISAVASAAATAMVVRSVARDFIPDEFHHYVSMKFRQFIGNFSNHLTLVIEEYDGLNPNHLYQAAEVYLATIISPSTKRIRVTKPQKESKINLSMEPNEQLKDTFSGFDLQWRLVCKQVKSKYVSDPDHEYGSSLKSELRSFELSFHKRHKNIVIEGYLPWILEKSKVLQEQKKTLKLFTLKRDRVIHSGRNNPWQSVNLDHPATFDKLAMDWEAKTAVMEDLERFVRRKEFYRRVGKAWKRGYLLFGPPGTGKSSLIAAMANHLNFDVYDLELSEIRSNGELRNMLISTANQSILVVEDIDCSIQLPDRQGGGGGGAGGGGGWVFDSFGRKTQGGTITLSGLLNFIDGLWSSCGDERIIVFTTNHKEKLDPALLRPGRMDVHIHMSYCTPSGFKMLASTYLGITEHPLFMEVEELIEMKKVTPAEVGEHLLKIEGSESALEGLIKFLNEKKEIEGIKDGKIEEKASPDLSDVVNGEIEQKEDGKGQEIQEM